MKLRSWWVRLPLWLQAVSLGTVVFIYWHVSGWIRPVRTDRLIDISFLEGLCLVGAWLLLQAANKPGMTERMAGAIRWMSAGMLIQGIGGAYLIGIVGFPARSALGWVPSIFFGAGYLATAAGLVLLPSPPGEGRQLGRNLIQASTFIVGAGLPIWFFAVQPQLSRTSGLGLVPILLLPGASFAGLLTASWASETKLVYPTRLAFQLLLTGFGLLWLGNIILSIDRATGIIPGGTIRWVNAVNGAAFCLCILGAWHLRHDSAVPGRRRSLVEFSPLPLTTIVVEVGFILLVVSLGKPDTQALIRLVTGLGAFLAFFLVREVFVIRDRLRLLAGEARQEEQSRFEALVRHSCDPILVVGADRAIRFASPAAETEFSTPGATVVGRDLVTLVHPEDRAKAERFLNELVLSPAETRTIRWRLANSRGAICDFETAGSNRLSEPAIGGLVLNSRDVTERTNLEEQLHRARKMEAVGRLAGGVAHDFNNLLTILLTNADLALRIMPATDPAKSLVEQIREASKRGSALTGRMLAFSRTDSIKPEAVPAKDLVGDAIPMLEQMIGAQVKLLTRVAPLEGGVKINPDEFIHALINLGANARDAMPEGGTLTVAAYPAPATQRPANTYLEPGPGPHIVVEVTDTGVGMDEATRIRAFEPFFTTKEKSKGTGLGLASVYGMVKAAGGGISLRTGKGLGTTIQLWLPGVPLEVPAARLPQGPAPTGGTGTILLVEDEEALRQAASRILESAGFEVVAAAEADEARRAFERQGGHVDLLVADVIMPGRSGPRLAAELLRLQPGLRVLLISGFTGDHLAAEGLMPAGAQLLPKPFTGDELVARVRSAIAQ